MAILLGGRAATPGSQPAPERFTLPYCLLGDDEPRKEPMVRHTTYGGAEIKEPVTPKCRMNDGTVGSTGPKRLKVVCREHPTGCYSK